MLDLTRHPRLLQLVSLWDRAAGVVRRWRARGGPSADPLVQLYEQVWSEAADVLGATIHSLDCGAYEIRQGPACTRVLGPATALDSLATHRIVRYKSAAYRLLRDHGLPTPRF